MKIMVTKTITSMIKLHTTNIKKHNKKRKIKGELRLKIYTQILNNSTSVFDVQKQVQQVIQNFLKMVYYV